MSKIIDFETYRRSFVAQTRQRLSRAERKQTRRRRYTDNLLDLETQRARPTKPRRRCWSRPGPPRRSLPACCPTLSEARALAVWLLHCERDCMISHFERRLAETIVEKADARRHVTRWDANRLMRTVNRVRA
ncbi:hypothetical protein [Mesorhizobium sp. YM1C-6-2]|uniref:hypothetical protein n=1 Tax=Mesorhizobium sp. YM1C-6-2 TaxID=1827501 RepID=UPI0011C3D63D|nr:hypothetical protein [Mesorhizobium sp. YM1C-6-2]